MRRIGPRGWGAAYTILALAAAISPGVPTLLAGTAPPYRPDLAVLTLTLVALIWYTVFTYEILTSSKRERDRKRKTLASGLLAELWWLDTILRELHVGASPAYDVLDAHLLNSAIADSTLFDPTTAHQLGLFHSLLQDTRRLLSVTTLKLNEAPASLRVAQAKIRFTLATIPPLVECLRREGARWKGPPSLDVGSGGQDLPPSPFARASEE